MALILAINPGNSHSPTLARLARELRGCELIGAESCKVAITAINQRVPDIVLLPDRPPRGEAELFARLKAVPGGVPTLQLPPVASADPVALAKEIRKLLAGEATAPPPAPPAKPVGVARPVAITPSVVTARPTAGPKPVGASPQVTAAARAAVTWIRLQRAQWAELDALDVVIERDAHEPDASSAPFTARNIVDLKESHEPRDSAEPELAASRDTTRSHEPSEPHEPYELHEPHEPHEPNEPNEPYKSDEPRKPAVRWLPRMAGLAVAAGLVVAGAWFWLQMSGNATNTAAVSTPSEPARVETSVPPVPSEPSSPGEPVAAESDPAAKTSGWIAISAPFAVSVTSANEAILLDDRGRGMLAPGKYRLRFQNTQLGYDEARVVEVRATATTTINLTPQTTLHVTSNEPAEVLIDGTNAGQTPFDSRISIGPHTVTIRTAGGERQFTIDATMKPVRLDADFSKPQP